MLDLLYEYKQTLRNTKRQLQELIGIPEEQKTMQQISDIKTYRNITNDLKYVTEWLENGRTPGAKRGYDRREAYKRLSYTNNEVLDFLNYHVADQAAEDSDPINDWDKERIDDALSELTTTEKDVFLMHVAELFSFEEIAALMNVKKGTVQKHYERGLKKIRKRAVDSLLCLP
ncbi:sigma-70 family RNA polymerase sigma factor [Halobacillus salinarum]|uniref:Sigma-70 family RNA polymerase sigma factor n=1 Tax=Halobacillus salinarum TaxID=2932257 RepID=A0ABY4EGU5_9BACI|nr:sigma-70 family RNA polymerase sigma factor [Halobacillus salinarum]UOQ43369.1 sigma-70 family RNA polymerase sigma factor [Halobacillus salinarum]